MLFASINRFGISAGTSHLNSIHLRKLVDRLADNCFVLLRLHFAAEDVARQRNGRLHALLGDLIQRLVLGDRDVRDSSVSLALSRVAGLGYDLVLRQLCVFPSSGYDLPRLVSRRS